MEGGGSGGVGGHGLAEGAHKSLVDADRSPIDGRIPQGLSNLTLKLLLREM